MLRQTSPDLPELDDPGRDPSLPCPRHGRNASPSRARVSCSPSWAPPQAARRGWPWRSPADRRRDCQRRQRASVPRVRHRIGKTTTEDMAVLRTISWVCSTRTTTSTRRTGRRELAPRSTKFASRQNAHPLRRHITVGQSSALRPRRRAGGERRDPKAARGDGQCLRSFSAPRPAASG